jgi:hypothetical protein
VAVFATATTAAADDLRPDQTYFGGSRITSSAHGVSFVVPSGWVGKFGRDAASHVLVMGSNTLEGLGLAILQVGPSPAELRAGLAEPQDLGAGVVLRPTAPPLAQGARIAARYLNEAYIGRALALVGPTGATSVVFFFTGPHRNEGAYGQLVEQLAASTNFFAPASAAAPRDSPAAGNQAQTWSNLLAGQMLHYFSTYNSGGGGGGMAAKRVLHLCSDGRFAYSGDSAVTMNVPGATGSAGGRSGFRGQWRIESPTQDSAMLVLSGDDGRQIRWRVQYDGSKTFVNGQRWLRAASDACR